MLLAQRGTHFCPCCQV
ncbi:MAG: zinc finger domain-containing protein [Candidatus Methylomirabilales bacterium]